MFMETLLSILEELVPQKVLGKKFGCCKRCKVRRSCWRKLARINKRLLSTKSVKVIAKLLNQKQSAENTLKSSYSSEGCCEQEARVVGQMKSNVKAFFAFGRARQKTKARVGPFLDPISGAPNSDPQF